MSIIKTDECVCCDLPCMGALCPYKNVIHKICDGCDNEFNNVYKYNKQVYCKDCLILVLEQDGIIEEGEFDDDFI